MNRIRSSLRNPFILGVIGIWVIACCLLVIVFGVAEPIEGLPSFRALVGETATPAPTLTPPEPTEPPPPSETPLPSSTPAPTDTPGPTDTPLPTPTETATPTATATFTPLLVSGNGDTVIPLNLPDGFIGFVHIEGNESGRQFSVWSLDANDKPIDQLVNTSSAYDGYRPLNFSGGETPVRLEVDAGDAWTIEVLHISAIETVAVPGTLEGEGDMVFALADDTAESADILGTETLRSFAMWAYSADGVIELLVNVSGTYTGTVDIPADTAYLEVQAVGEWSIEFSEP